VPELPEVETVVRDLRPLLTGRRIKSVWTSRFKLRKPWTARWKGRLVGRQIESVDRRGKWIVLNLDDGEALVFHLGMTGQLTVRPAQRPGGDHVHLKLGLDRGMQVLSFRDIRRFGSATLVKDAKALQKFFDAAKLGPEPFGVDPEYWRQRLKAADRNLKAVLLDQRVVAGVGNIYADESLFEAKLYPGRRACRLTAAEAERLRKAIETVLTRAIKRRGSSISNYVGGSGLQGSYQKEFRAYGRTGEPCPRCKTPIAHMRLAGRSTHYCPRCQPRRRPSP
jgi:formamidopyrimidine-DNA glycosylase